MSYAAAFNMSFKCCTSGVVPFQVGACYELGAGFINFNDVIGDIRIVERLLQSGRQAHSNRALPLEAPFELRVQSVFLIANLQTK